MKKIFLILLIILSEGIIGCAGFVTHQTAVTPPRGFLFEVYKAPLTTDFNHTKVGTNDIIKFSSSKTSYLLELHTGATAAWDAASVPEIARKGGIQHVTYADYEVLNILDIYATFTINVYGY